MRHALLLVFLMPTALGAQHSASTSLDSLAHETATYTARYADRRVASADGYHRVGTDFPGMGEHRDQTDALLSPTLDARHPAVLIYASIAGKPQLLGVAFATITSGTESANVPGWPDAWHEHSGLLSEESGVGASSHDSSGTRFWVLHAWTAFANPEGMFTTDNWALPFLRAQLDPPVGADPDAAHAISLVFGGDDYIRNVLTDAGLRSASNGASVDSAIASTRAAAAAIIAMPRPDKSLSAQQLAILRNAWRSLSSSLTQIIGTDVSRYLAPQHSAHHS